MKFKIYDLTLTAAFAVILVVCSWIQIPSIVPFTLQTFAVFACLLIIGGKRGCAAIAVYIALGAFGLPVFHGFTGGLGILTGPTGGYIFGFLLIGICYLLITEIAGEKLKTMCMALIFGLIICYLCGTVWFMTAAESSNLTAALISCVIPFIIPDTIKLILAVWLSKRLKSAVKSQRYFPAG